MGDISLQHLKIKMNKLGRKKNNCKRNINSEMLNLNIFLETEDMESIGENIIKEYEELWS